MLERVKGILRKLVKGNLRVMLVAEAWRATRTGGIRSEGTSTDFVKEVKFLEYLMCLSIYLGDLDNWQKVWDQIMDLVTKLSKQTRKTLVNCRESNVVKENKN